MSGLPLKPGYENWIVVITGGPPNSSSGAILLDTAAAAALLGVSSARVYQICKADDLRPITRIGRIYFFLKDDVEQLRQRRRAS